MLYEMLTGRVPFIGPNPLAVMNERVLNEPTAPRELNREISPQLEEILYRALERDPRHRYATAHEMAWDLQNQDQVGVEERSVGQAGRGWRARMNAKVLLYTGLALVPMVLFGLMLLLAKR
jgi:serine/threonine-protein kinase